MRPISAVHRRWLLRLVIIAGSALITALALPPVVAVAAPRMGPAFGGVAVARLQPPAQEDTGSSGAAPGRGAPQQRTSTAQQRAQEAEQRERAAAVAAKRAAQLAQAGQRARGIWEARGRPRKLAVIRPNTIDLITAGRLTRLPRPAGDLTLVALDRYLPTSWLSINGRTARLAATVVLTPRTTLDIGGEVTLLQLTGGAGLPAAASIYTGGGRLLFRGVTVTSADPVAAQPMPAAPGRPFIVVSPGGRLDAADATFSDLGTPNTEPEDRPGVQFNTGSTGSLVRTTLLRNSTGLRLTETQNVHLADVTVSESLGDGLVLDNNHGTVMAGIRAVRNRGDGVKVAGTGTDHLITGITTADNGGFGLAAIRVTDTRLTGLHTIGNAAGGLEIAQASAVTVTDLTATNEPIGVYTHIGSTNILVDHLTATGGRRGVVIEKSTKHLTLQASTITRAKVTGVAIGGTDIKLHDVSVSDARTNVRIERGADTVTATGLHLAGGKDGLVATPGSTRVTLRDISAYAIANDAVRSFSPDTQIRGGTITGAATGIHLAASATISDTSINLVNEGIRARSTGLIHADHIDISAVAVGIDAAPTTEFRLTRSRVHALDAVRGELTQNGTNEFSLPPLNLLGAIGLPLVLLALVLQHIHLARQRHTTTNAHRWTPPSVPATSVRKSLSRSTLDTGPQTRPRRRSPPRPSPTPAPPLPAD